MPIEKEPFSESYKKNSLTKLYQIYRRGLGAIALKDSDSGKLELQINESETARTITEWD